LLNRRALDEVVVISDCTLADAVVVADRLRAALPASVTCSAGVAELGEMSSAAELVGRADQALYAAKAAGRNCTRADAKSSSLTGALDAK
jgi:GGDEF domain-containing protein